MKRIRFLKEPGYVYDLYFLFALHFNKSYFVEQLPDHLRAEGEKHYERLLEYYGPFPEVLRPFFALRQDKKSFMSLYYYAPYAHRFATDFSLSLIQIDLMDCESVVDKLLRFYFTSIDEETLAECKTSVKALSRLIFHSEYSAEVKNGLYAVFLDPATYIQKLNLQLITKGYKLSNQYEQSRDVFSELESNFDWDETKAFYQNEYNRKINLSDKKYIYVSFALNYSYILTMHCEDVAATLILGKFYKKVIQYLKGKNNVANFKDFGSIISDATRMDILEMLLSREEAPIKEIEDQFGLTSANAYYHVSMMMKAGVLQSRNEGRLLYYSINRTFFRELQKWVDRYI